MWKYVSRRIRDVCDRTYNVLDTRRPWQCGGERFCAENNHPEDHQAQQQQERKYCKRDESIPGATYCLLNVFKKNQSVAGAKPWNNDTGSNHSEREGFRRKEFCPSQHSWVGAITWTSAIICGWYTSQLICLYRRNCKWEGPKCFPYLISSVHKIPHEFQNSKIWNCPLPAPPVPPAIEEKPQQQVTFFGIPISFAKASKLPDLDFNELAVPQKNFLLQVNNEKHKENKDSAGESLQAFEKHQSPTIESAMENLVSVIGEIEFQLGLQNLETGDYPTAVSHLKMGASHRHAGAAFNLGICYEQGFGVKKNSRLAIECYHMASTLGHAQAMYNLGVYYARGLGGLRRSRTIAKKYFIAAAELGLEDAVAALGPKYRARRDSESASSSLSSTPSADLSEYGYSFNELDQYGFDGHKPTGQMEQIKLRLVSAMG